MDFLGRQSREQVDELLAPGEAGGTSDRLEVESGAGQVSLGAKQRHQVQMGRATEIRMAHHRLGQFWIVFQKRRNEFGQPRWPVLFGALLQTIELAVERED